MSRRPRTGAGPALGFVAPALALALVLAACGDAGTDQAAAGGASDVAATDGSATETGADADCGVASSTVSFDRTRGTGALPAWGFATLGAPDRTVCTTDWEGTPTVVNFWATWCEFCIDEMPDLEAANQRLGDQVRFVGVDVQDNVDDARALVDETGVTYDSVIDPRQQDGFYGEVGGRGMPTTLFVDAEGTIVHRYTGPITEQQVLDLVTEHLGVTS